MPGDEHFEWINVKWLCFEVWTAFHQVMSGCCVVWSRALARIGTSYYKKNDLKNAVTFYNKSLSEHRDPDVVKKSQEVCA